MYIYIQCVYFLCGIFYLALVICVDAVFGSHINQCFFAHVPSLSLTMSLYTQVFSCSQSANTYTMLANSLYTLKHAEIQWSRTWRSHIAFQLPCCSQLKAYFIITFPFWTGSIYLAIQEKSSAHPGSLSFFLSLFVFCTKVLLIIKSTNSSWIVRRPKLGKKDEGLNEQCLVL